MNKKATPDEALTPITEGIWERRQPLRFFGLALGSRMTVVRLDSGKLWVHSPVPLDDHALAQMNQLGEVGYVIAPNRLHHLQLNAMRNRYPNAEYWGSPGLAQKRQDFRFTGLLSDDARPNWHKEIQHKQLLGMPAVDEVAFFAQQNKALIFTDCVFNLSHSTPTFTRLFFQLVGGVDQCRPPLELKLLVRDKKQFRSSIEAVFKWPFEIIVMSHGEVVRDRARDRLQQGYSWLFSA